MATGLQKVGNRIKLLHGQPKKQNWLPKGQIGKNISFEHWVSTKNTNSGHFQGMEEARVGVLGDDQKKSGLGDN